MRAKDAALTRRDTDAGVVGAGGRRPARELAVRMLGLVGRDEAVPALAVALKAKDGKPLKLEVRS